MSTKKYLGQRKTSPREVLKHSVYSRKVECYDIFCSVILILSSNYHKFKF